MKLIIEGSEEDRVLHLKAKRVNKVDDTVRNQLVRMEEIMREHNGIGISGNQVGLLKRLIVIWTNDWEPPDKVIHMINPEIIYTFPDLVNGEEGCLSLPEKFIHKKRYKKIRVKYRDTKGKPHIECYDGLTARVIQHEIDHLDGVLMTDD